MHSFSTYDLDILVFFSNLLVPHFKITDHNFIEYLNSVAKNIFDYLLQKAYNCQELNLYLILILHFVNQAFLNCNKTKEYSY